VTFLVNVYLGGVAVAFISALVYLVRPPFFRTLWAAAIIAVLWPAAIGLSLAARFVEWRE